MGLDHRRDYGKGAEKAGQTVESLAVKDPGPGWIPWEGGEQPRETHGKMVRYRMRSHGPHEYDEYPEDPADDLRWQHASQMPEAASWVFPQNDIVAYRIVKELGEPVPAAWIEVEATIGSLGPTKL